MAQGTFHIITFGCQMNVNDSFWLARSLQRRGFVESPLEKAEVVILNTCSVRDKPEQKVYAALGRIKYETRRVPGSFAVVAGCVAQQIGAGFFERFPQVRLVVGGDGLAMAPDAIERLHGDPSLRLNLTDFSEIYPERDPALPAQGEGEIPPVAFVNIMQGCDNFCTYCIVPFTRGRQKSRDAGAILDECRALIDNGAKEITLLGQNVNSYGKDLEEPMDFADLLERVNAIPGEFLIRFMTSHPKDATHKLFETMARCEKVAPVLHLPFQAGNDRILKAMNRVYDRAGYLDKVRRLRQAIPDVVITSDVIVGFPGETAEEFEDTMTLIDEVRFDALFTFIFSPREGTPAAKMDDPIPKAEKAAHFQRLVERQDQISEEKHAAYIGKTVRCLVDGKDDKGLTARTPGNRLVRLTGGEGLIGQFVDVKITGANKWSLSGEPA